MKRIMITVMGTLLFFSSFSQVKLHLGIRGGVGEMLTHQQLRDLPTVEGIHNVSTDRPGWSVPFKGEALLGWRRLRVGYQFMYNYAQPSITAMSFTPTVSDAQNTMYFNPGKTHLFAHYLLVELAVINAKRFSLVPGVAVGSYTGFRVDKTTGERVQLTQVTDKRFSIGAELNAEIKFGRGTFLIGPNYYLFSLRDKANAKWKEYQHFIGVDVGLRVNILKQ